MESPSYLNETSVKKFGLWKVRPEAEQMNDRMIITNAADLEVPDNSIHTSKYSYITFVPLNLLDQFSKLANVYFLIIGVMQMIPAISITNGQPVIFGPLTIVVGVSMIKDFMEDYSRHKSDAEENNRSTSVLRTGIQDVRQATLRIGDVIRVQQDTQIPADILILRSSDPRGNCFIETKNLDGETNLKNKNIHKDLQNLEKMSDSELEALRIQVDYEKPNPYLYRFNGSVSVNGKRIPLDDKNFVLRGCVLRNVKYVYGLVCYNGHDTKIMLNSVKGRPKHSHLEAAMNTYIMVIFALQMSMCLMSGLLNSFWQSSHNVSLTYLQIAPGDAENSFVKNLFTKWGNWILIFTNFVPISLLVSLEMVKYFQGMLISSDPGTYSLEYDIKCQVHSSNLNEELGQVQYIFSDKTGTLTKNLMDYKCLTVGGKSYGQQQTMNLTDINRRPKVSNVDFKDQTFFNDLSNGSNQRQLNEFLLSLVLCHTVVIEEKQGEIIYQASSPDELALLNFAKYSGYAFEGLDGQNFMQININGSKQRYRLLHVLEFNSTRKRMSVILEDSTGRITLYTKGADSVIEKRMKINDIQLKQKTWEHLESYATIGLRTLIVAKRIIDRNIFQAWDTKYRNACSQIQNRERTVMAVQDEIEIDLELVGGTAIEDKLQEDVGPTISLLKEAGIKVWVLTGDKIETAINIGYACQLLNDSLAQIIVDGVDEQTISNALETGLRRSEEAGKHALVISGDALIIAMQTKYSAKVMYIADRCEAVVACRVSPKQKQEIVSLVRTEKPTVTTLAIGDGANDVNMITAAHVGIGIKGVEGQQAARSADYAVGEFRMLRRLTLYHGRESYRKNSRLVLYNFFKNMMLVLPQFWWAFYNGFSAVSLYDPLMYQSYNLFFTALPIIIYAIFDSEFAPETLCQHPNYYDIGISSKLFNLKVFLQWLANGALQAAIVGVCTYLFLENTATSQTIGLTTGFWVSGTAVLGYAVFIGNIKILIFSNSITLGLVLSLIVSLGSFLVIYALESASLTSLDIYNTMNSAYAHTKFYVVSLVILGATSLVDLGVTRFDSFHQYQNTLIQHDKHVVLNEDMVHQTQLNPNQINLEPIKRKASHTGFAFSQDEMRI